ncbi:hypothetical protein [Streptomyces sp. NBC_01233]|uniref:hypothetical protein n=1 Tax=Streptomyces sp. NBC_01233 TaxID=2903787 RepID=UPI002E1224B8|nr:hypothetical protein OG332_47445 [Streptomyces sp. NBC_01233]
MNLLLSKPKRVVKNFCQEHGDMEGWTAEDFGLLYDLLIVAHAPGPLRRLWLRAQVLAILAYAMPLYALAELVHAVRGSCWLPLEHHLDQVDERWTAASKVCAMASGRAFVARVADTGERITDATCRVTGRLAKV